MVDAQPEDSKRIDVTSDEAQREVQRLCAVVDTGEADGCSTPDAVPRSHEPDAEVGV